MLLPTVGSYFKVNIQVALRAWTVNFFPNSGGKMGPVFYRNHLDMPEKFKLLNKTIDLQV